jgi:hypothetical protein
MERQTPELAGKIVETILKNPFSLQGGAGR